MGTFLDVYIQLDGLYQSIFLPQGYAFCLWRQTAQLSFVPE
jgi:hypothetical protein